MTSGQGGTPGEPSGQPPSGPSGWEKPSPGGPPSAPDHGPQGRPPAPPGHPQAPGYPQGQQAPPGYPQGQQPPPGYPQAPGYPPSPGYPPAPQGYAPAPSAPTGWGAQAPQPLERPATVRAGIGAFTAHIILGIVSSIFLFTDQRDLIDQALRQAGADTTEDVARVALTVVAVIALIFVGLEVMFLAFAWNGRNWARIVLWVLFGLNVVSGLTAAFGGSPYGGFYTSIAVIQLLLAIAGIVLLALKPSNDWYAYRKWARVTGQGR
jgi:uncharacterized protein (DUF983 family)